MKKHGFMSTDIEHHGDGSMTVRHTHKEPEKSIAHAAADLDGLHDSIQDHLNPEQAEEMIHPGIHSQMDEAGIEDQDERQRAEDLIHPGINKLAAKIAEE